MGAGIQVFSRHFLKPTLDVAGNAIRIKYEWRINGKSVGVGMESIPELIEDISETMRKECKGHGGEIIISAPRPEIGESCKNSILLPLNLEEREEFATLAPLFSYEKDFLPN